MFGLGLGPGPGPGRSLPLLLGKEFRDYLSVPPLGLGEAGVVLLDFVHFVFVLIRKLRREPHL